MKVEILTAKEKIVEEDAKEAVFPGEDGEFSVMDFHQPCLYNLRPGQITVRPRNKEEETKRFRVIRGIVKVEPLRVVALIET